MCHNSLWGQALNVLRAGTSKIPGSPSVVTVIISNPPFMSIKVSDHAYSLLCCWHFILLVWKLWSLWSQFLSLTHWSLFYFPSFFLLYVINTSAEQTPSGTFFAFSSKLSSWPTQHTFFFVPFLLRLLQLWWSSHLFNGFPLNL